MARRKNPQTETESATDEPSESLLGLDADDGDEGGDGEPGTAAVAMDDDEDDIAVAERETELVPEEHDDGLTEKDRAEYRKAFKEGQEQTTVELPKQPEKTPSGKAIYAYENISVVIGGRRAVIKAGQPIPRGVVSKARLALLLDQRKAAAAPPKRKRKTESLLGL